MFVRLGLLGFGVSSGASLRAQSPLTGLFAGDAGSPPAIVAGRAVNAVSGAPLPRALVEINGHAMLTDGEGRFRFEEPGTQASALRLRKPGFLTTPEMEGDGALRTGTADALTVMLWPEAVLVGTVTAPDGDVLARVAVVARRSAFDEQGRHFQVAGQSQTDSHGQFRIAVPAGDYVLETQFSPRAFEREEAVLPYTFPPASTGKAEDVFHVASGEERRIDLRPVVGKTHVVTIPVEGDDGQPPRITARWSGGATFSANGFRAQQPGSVRLNLPSGSYSLRATRFSRDGMEFGQSEVTVADHDVTGPPFHLASSPSVPVDVVSDATNLQTQGPSTAGRVAAGTPSFMQFNLVLEPTEVDLTSPFQIGIRPTQGRDGSASFSAPPGAYRLYAGLVSGWYVRSATSRGSDLIREPLVISSGSSPSPITLVVSNQTGSLQGTVSLGGAPAACWVYLIASTPTLPQVIVRRSDSTGSFRIADLPPGSYRAVAFPYRHSADLEDPAVLGQFSTHVGGFSVTSGSTANLSLEAVTLQEMPR